MATPPTNPDASKSSSVLIIGAGMSGLCAARALTNAGHENVTVIEARDYVGGRTITKEVGSTGVMVDAGAAWMHGTRGNPLVGMCEHYGVPYVEHREMKTSNAAIVELSDDKKVRTAWAAEDAEKLMPVVYEVISALKPGVSAVDSFKGFVDGRSDLDEVQKRRAMFMMEQIIGGAAGPMDDLNVYFPMTQTTGRLAEGYDQLISGGYNSLISKLAEGLKVELNKAVAGVEDVAGDAKQVKVTCEDGSEYVADFVICSVPLGVLKANAIEFQPALPEKMTSALDRLAMGGFEKVILVWHDHWYKGWKENFDEFKDNKIFVDSDMSNPGSSPFPLWIDISGKTSKPTVVCLYAGKFAQDLQKSGKTDDEIVADAIESFAAGLGKTVEEIPEPVATMCTRWHTDPYSYGSYSYIPVAATAEDLDFEPIFGGRLMICGEHTIKEHNASVHGPVLSGLREALRLDEDAHIENVTPGIIPK